MTNDTLQNYWEALDRIKNGRPKVVPKGVRPSNDTVSMEAGRGRGSIKKSRPEFADLIAAIAQAAAEQSKPKMDGEARLNRAKVKADDLQRELDAALAREMSLVYELFQVRKQLAKLTGEKVIPIRHGDAKIGSKNGL